MTVRRPMSIPPKRPVVIVGGGTGGAGGSAIVAKQFPLWGKGHPVYFWAYQGLVWFENGNPDADPRDKFRHMTARDALKRLNGVNEMLIRSSEDRRWLHERQVCQQFVEEMTEVCRQAQDQGNPMENVDYLAEAKRRRPKTSLVPQIVDVEI